MKTNIGFSTSKLEKKKFEGPKNQNQKLNAFHNEQKKICFQVHFLLDRSNRR